MFDDWKKKKGLIFKEAHKGSTAGKRPTYIVD